MKQLLVFSLFLVLASSFSGCKKERPFDYRNKFTGKFTINYSYTIEDGQEVQQVNETYDGKISYDNTIDREHAVIDYGKGTLEVVLTRDGNMLLPDGPMIGDFTDTKDRFRVALKKSVSPFGTVLTISGDRK